MVQHILIHGLGQTSLSWEKTIKFLSDTDNIYSPNLWTLLNDKDVTYANLYRSFSDFCNDAVGKINLCGLSLGAILALNYALDYPEKVQSLVLIGAQYKMPKGLLLFQNFIFQFMPKKMFEQMGISKNDVITLTNSMVGLDFSEKLKDISCATLIVCGEKDNANSKAAKIFVEQIPNAQFHSIKDVGHEVNLEAPQDIAVILNAFWEVYI